MEEKYDDFINTLEQYEDIWMDKLNDDDWRFMSSRCNLSESFLRKYKEKVFWSAVSIGIKMSEDFIMEMEEYVDWKYIFQYQDVSEDFIVDNIIYVRQEKWRNLDYTFDFSEEFLFRYKKYLRWDIITQEKCKEWSLDFIEKFKDNILFHVLISIRKDLHTLEFLEKYEDKINFDFLRIEDIKSPIVKRFADKIDFRPIIMKKYEKPKKELKKSVGVQCM